MLSKLADLAIIILMFLCLGFISLILWTAFIRAVA